jgi:hypothetical protein
VRDRPERDFRCPCKPGGALCRALGRYTVTFDAMRDEECDDFYRFGSARRLTVRAWVITNGAEREFGGETILPLPHGGHNHVEAMRVSLYEQLFREITAYVNNGALTPRGDSSH